MLRALTVLIFVSFSMPKQSLVSVLQDAQKIQAPVFIQGLVDHNFKSTFLRIGDLVKEAGGGGLSIDPRGFERYHITQVPTVVVSKEGTSPFVGGGGRRPEGGYIKTCIDQVVGDIPLSTALKHLQHHGDCSSPDIPLLLERLEKGNAHA